MKLSTAIMAHPKRMRSVERLQKMLDREATLVLDAKGCRWDTGRRSLLAYDPTATHHLVVQDDGLPAADLCAALERWIPTLPVPERSVLCLYAGNIGRFRRTIAPTNPKAPCWLQMEKVQWGVALVLPTALIEDAVKHGDTLAEVSNYDMKISLWAQRNKLPIYYPFPSWVNHDPGPSLIKGHGKDRQAMLALKASQSALTGWSTKAPPIVQVPDFVRPGDGAPPLRPAQRRNRGLYTMTAPNQRHRVR